MHDTIVVGVDGSQPGRAALLWAASRARRSQARLLLVHALDPRPLDPHALDPHALDPHALEAHGRGPIDVAEERGSPGRELLERERAIAETAAPGIRIDVDLLEGDPVWALAAGYPSVRAVVVGSHKTGFLRGSSFGSRSLQLAAASIAPVVVVPATSDPATRGVVVGLDAHPDGVAALEFAVRQARDTGDELVLVRSLPTRPPSRGEHPVEPSSGTVFSTALLEDARRRVKTLAPGLTIRSRIVHGPAAQGLVRAAAHASLLVVGRSQADGEAAAMGRVAHDVLLNLAAPTAVVSAERTSRAASAEGTSGAVSGAASAAIAPGLRATTFVGHNGA